jgi:hypothetical protein
MSTDDTPRQKSIEAARAFLGRTDYGDEIFDAALNSIATRGVDVPEAPHPSKTADHESSPIDGLTRDMQVMAARGRGYMELAFGLMWLVSRLLAEIERQSGTRPADTLTTIEKALHEPTPE